MKKSNLIKQAIMLLSIFLFTASFSVAQDKPANKKSDCSKKVSCAKTVKAAKHVCTKECKTLGCKAVKAKEGKTADKHVCTAECKTVGCKAVKDKQAKLSNKNNSKTVNSNSKGQVCNDKCKDGCTTKN